MGIQLRPRQGHSSRPRPIVVPSGILIHPAVCPQQTWAKNWWLCPIFWGGSPCHTMWLWPGPTSVASGSIQPFGHNRHGPKIGGCARFFAGEGAGFLSNTTSPGPRSTSVPTLPSGILMHPTVWPQYMDRTLAAAFWGGELTQRRLGRGLPPYQVATTDMSRKWGAVPLCGRAGFPSSIMWRGPRPTTVASFILIHPAVWPQYTNVTYRTGQTFSTERHTGQRSDSIGQTVLQRRSRCHLVFGLGWTKGGCVGSTLAPPGEYN